MLQQLNSFLGPAFPTQPVGFEVTRWYAEPWIRGGYSFQKPGYFRDIAIIGAAHWGGRLLFAGEHLSMVQQSSVHGAMSSANVAVSQIPAYEAPAAAPEQRNQSYECDECLAASAETACLGAIVNCTAGECAWCEYSLFYNPDSPSPLCGVGQACEAVNCLIRACPVCQEPLVACAAVSGCQATYAGICDPRATAFPPCCSGLRCVRHASNCNGTYVNEHRCINFIN